MCRLQRRQAVVSMTIENDLAINFNLDDIDFNIPNIGTISDEKSFIPKYPTHHYAINHARTATFFSLRRFTEKNKKKQLETIRRYKDVYNSDFIDMVAGDFYAFLHSLFQGVKGFYVTNLPPGNSVGKPFHLATEIGKKLSSKLGVEYLSVFKPYLRKNYNVSDITNKMRLLMEDVDIPDKVIVIDDVATTGTSIESAMNRLRAAGRMVIPVVWVMGGIKTL
jgi:phosphoribosylpyrophosphate synthetase